MRRLIPSFVAVSMLSLTIAACSGGSSTTKRGTAGSNGETTSSAPAVAVAVALQLGTPAAVGPDVNAAFAGGAATTAHRVIARYIGEASVAPLETGRLGTRFFALFTPDAAKRLRAHPSELAALSDTAQGTATHSTRIHGTLHLTALVDAKKAVMVSATINTAVKVQSTHGTIVTTRAGDLLLVRASGGRYLIAGYDLRVTRTDATGASSTTTAMSAP